MMGPSCLKRARKSSSRRRILFNKHLANSKNQENSADTPVKSSNDSSKMENLECQETCSSNACSTPKAERFRIPEMKTCPLAPKKRRTDVASCSLRRSSIAFVAPPDIELFFSFALRGIQV